MNRLFRALSPYIALAGCVIFFWLGIHTIHLRSYYAETTAVITDIQTDYTGDETTHHVFVAYTVNGTDYERELGEYSSGMHTGKEVAVMYDPADPGQIIPAGLFGVIMEFFMGVLCLGACVGLFIQKINRR